MLVAVATVTLATTTQPATGEAPAPLNNETPTAVKIAAPQAEKPGPVEVIRHKPGEDVSKSKTRPVEAKPKPAPKPVTKPAPKPAASSGGNIELIVRQAARHYGLNEDHFVSIARCESSLNPNAVNYGYNENGYPSGLFQHLSGYWPARAAQYGYTGANVFDATANAYVTAAMWAEGQSYLWECQ